ncbi:MAG: enoyl-CoA hydratase/isomerase family protein [Planctomycetes bacterium]|nr:enoyl-CoA hydratase/isomerase family protein [Planctomycetota bacterium]
MLLFEKRDAVLLLTLNRPEKRNSLHPDLIGRLTEILSQTEHDRSVAVVVFTGAGPSFCAGLDLNHLLGLDPDGKVAYMKTLFRLFEQLYTLPQPVLAAINGPAIAGGFDLAALCDLRWCAPEATFAQTEVLLGLTQLIYPIYKAIGLGRAKELAFTGEAISAEEAYRIGLVNGILPGEALLERTLKRAELLSKRPREALLESKRVAREVIEMDTGSAFRRMLESLCERLRSAEHRDESKKYLARLKRKE